MNTVSVLAPKRFSDLGLDQLNSPIWIYDVVNYRIHWANSAALGLWEAPSVVQLCQRDFRGGSSEAVQQTLLSYLDELERGQVIDRWWQISPNNIDKRVHCRFSGVYVEDEHLAMLIEGLHSDLLGEDVGSGAYGAVMLCLLNLDGEVLSTNPTFKSQFGTLPGSIQQILVDKKSMAAVLSPVALQGVSQQKPPQHNAPREVLLKTLKGERWHSFEVREHRDEQVQTEHERNWILTLIDVHDRKLEELKNAVAAQTDPLTGLYNRRGFTSALREILDQNFTIFYIDLDGFKPINDTYGHGVGDEVLVRISELLRYQIQQASICARLGGDEFVVAALGENIAQSDIAQDIIEAVSKPITINSDTQVVVTASIGSAQYPTDADTVDKILQRADSAMYLAKRRGRNRCLAYKDGMEVQLLRGQYILQHLDEAIENEAILFSYQPINDVRSAKAPMIEMQLSWEPEVLGKVSASELILAMEKANRISFYERRLISQLCKDFKHLISVIGSDVVLAVNLSAVQILDPGFFGRCQKSLAAHGFCLDQFVFEIDESNFRKIIKEDKNVLLQAKILGFQFALDNFGESGVPLSHLQELDFTYVKTNVRILSGDLSRSRFDKNVNDNAVLQCVLDMCKNLKLECVADGVSNEAQSKILSDKGILLQQGSYLGPACSASSYGK